MWSSDGDLTGGSQWRFRRMRKQPKYLRAMEWTTLRGGWMPLRPQDLLPVINPRPRVLHRKTRSHGCLPKRRHRRHPKRLPTCREHRQSLRLLTRVGRRSQLPRQLPLHRGRPAHRYGGLPQGRCQPESVRQTRRQRHLRWAPSAQACRRHHRPRERRHPHLRHSGPHRPD